MQGEKKKCGMEDYWVRKDTGENNTENVRMMGREEREEGRWC